MQLIKVVNKIKSFFPEYTFVQGEHFAWSSDAQRIFYRTPTRPEDLWSLLHEVAHAELGHATFGLDIELVSHETNAWAYAASVLGPRFRVKIDDEYVQDNLDTYRTWMFERSRCPNCGQNGLQTQNTYSCINCRCLWRANEARLCALRRTKLLAQNQTASL